MSGVWYLVCVCVSVSVLCMVREGERGRGGEERGE